MSVCPQSLTIPTQFPLIVAGHDVDTYGDTFVADERSRTRYELPDLILALMTEGALRRLSEIVRIWLGRFSLAEHRISYGCQTSLGADRLNSPAANPSREPITSSSISRKPGC